MASKRPRIVALIAALEEDKHDLLNEVVDRASWWADDVHVTCSSDFYENWHNTPDFAAAMLSGRPNDGNYTDPNGWWGPAWSNWELNAELREGDYVFMLTGTQIVTNHNWVKPFVRENPGHAIGCQIINFVENGLYLKERPRYDFPLFPYQRNVGAMRIDQVPAIPNYVYSLPYRNDPHLLIADYHMFGQEHNGDYYHRWEAGGLMYVG